MMRLQLAMYVGVLLCGLSGPAQAILFDFSWTGDPTQDATIVTSTDSTLMATGTIDINAAPGAAFSLADIGSTNISVTGNSIIDYVITGWTNAAGTISADGLSALFSTAGNPFSNPAGAAFFGCRFSQCSGTGNPIDAFIPASAGPARVTYGSAADAVASLRMTAAASVPEPGTLVLMGIALAGFGYKRSRSA